MVHEIVLLADKSPADYKSLSSLESCSSGQPLKSLDMSKPAATIVHHRTSYADTDNPRTSCDLKMHKSTNDMPALMSCEFSSSSMKLVEDLHENDSNSQCNTAGLADTRHSHSEIVQTVSTCSSTSSMVERTAVACSPSDCSMIQLVEDSLGLLPTTRNMGTSLERTIDTDLQNSLSLNTNNVSDAVKDSNDGAVKSGLQVNNDSALEQKDSVNPLLSARNSVTSFESSTDSDLQCSTSLTTNSASISVKDSNNDAVKSRLCVNTDLALDSKTIMATIMSPSEDFRSIYASNSSSSSSAVEGAKVAFESEVTHSHPDADSIDAWMEFPVPGKSPALSLCVSRRTVWYVDKAEQLYFSSLKGPGLSWNTVDKPAQQISCSPSGHIVWRVYRGSAYAAISKITGKSLSATEWREVAREVAYVAVDDSVVW